MYLHHGGAASDSEAHFLVEVELHDAEGCACLLARSTNDSTLETFSKVRRVVFVALSRVEANAKCGPTMPETCTCMPDHREMDAATTATDGKTYYRHLEG